MDVLRMVSIGREAMKLVPLIIAGVRVAERFLNKRGQEKEDIAIDVVMEDLVPLALDQGVGPEVLKAPEVQKTMRGVMVAVVAFVNAVRAEVSRLDAADTPATS